MKKIVYRRPDGGISIVTPVYEENAVKEIIKAAHALGEKIAIDGNLDEAAYLDWLIRKDVPTDATEIEIIEHDALPADRAFRNAWDKKDGEIIVDMPKARLIHLENLRKERNLKLQEMDIEFQKAFEVSDQAKITEIAQVKQALRDMPDTAIPEMEKIEDPEQLKDYQPEVLKESL